jgi:hypothetical protein
MAKPKSSKNSPSAPSPAPDHTEEKAEEPMAPEPRVSSTSLSSRDQQSLTRVVRFLVGIQSPQHARRARREGYSAKEHRDGWRLWREAAGATRPIDHWLAEIATKQPSDGNAERTALLRELDLFENTWFPRTRAIIRRAISPATRDAFAAGFFQDLEQQPVGPGVVGSVRTFVERVGSLAASRQNEARKLRAVLKERGLTEAKILAVRDLLARVEGAVPAKAPKKAAKGKKGPTEKALAAEIERAQAAQMQALADLRDWFNDWSTTLRMVFTAREQVQLGLVVLQRRGAAEGEPAEEPKAVIEE